MNRTEYIGKLNALYVGEKNCLEELITAYDEKGQEIERLNNIINELEKFLDEEYEFADTKVFPGAMAGVAMGQINRTKNKLQELKGSDKE